MATPVELLAGKISGKQEEIRRLKEIVRQINDLSVESNINSLSSTCSSVKCNDLFINEGYAYVDVIKMKIDEFTSKVLKIEEDVRNRASAITTAKMNIEAKISALESEKTALESEKRTEEAKDQALKKAGIS